MYASVRVGNPSTWRGIFTLDTDGNPTRFAPDIINAIGLEFDTTAANNFGGQLYAVGRTEDNEPWGIYSVQPNGNIKKFIAFDNINKKMMFCFGPDGFMYVAESTPYIKTVIVSRIMPRNTALYKLEEAIELKEEALEKVEEALINEQEAVAALNEMLSSGELGDLTYIDILKAKVNIYLSMLQERSVRHHLTKSIGRLQDAWTVLTGRDEYQGVFKRLKHSEMRRADINGDGAVNGLDFAILSKYWLETYDR